MGAVIAYRNLADSATITAPGAMAGYPASNMQTRQLAHVCRLTGFSPQITVDFGAAVQIDILALLNVNPLGDAPPPPPSIWIDLVVEYSADGSTWTTATANAPVDAGAPDLPRNIIVYPREAFTLSKVARRYWRISPTWTVGLGGYREIGRLWMGQSIEIPSGCDAGWGFAGRDPGTLDESAGLQIYADRRVRGRVVTMPMTGVDTSIAYGFADDATSAVYKPSLDDLINYAGSTGEVIAIHRASSPIWTRRTGVYGHLTPDSLRLRHQAGPNHACDLTIIEER
jgi:hypothetical protein